MTTPVYESKFVSLSKIDQNYITLHEEDFGKLQKVKFQK